MTWEGERRGMRHRCSVVACCGSTQHVSFAWEQYQDAVAICMRKINKHVDTCMILYYFTGSSKVDIFSGLFNFEFWALLVKALHKQNKKINWTPWLQYILKTRT
jgi:hypothetical protein